MKKTEEKSSRSAEGLYKFFIYFVLILLAVTIIVPVAWVLWHPSSRMQSSTATLGTACRILLAELRQCVEWSQDGRI